MKRELIECVPSKKKPEHCEIKVNGQLLGVFQSDDAANTLENLGLTCDKAAQWSQDACFGKIRHGQVTISDALSPPKGRELLRLADSTVSSRLRSPENSGAYLRTQPQTT